MLSILGSYKIKKTFAERKNESQQIKHKYPNRIPVICERSARNSKTTSNLDRSKYLVPYDLTIGQFLFVIRKRLKLDPSDALYLYVNGHIMACSSIFSVVYDNHKDLDGFLYLKYSEESTFGF